MPYWDLAEARLIQERYNASAANADSVDLLAGAAPYVPAGKVWIITGFGYYPSVAETQTVSVAKVTASGAIFGLINPVSLNLNPARLTFVEQGMECPLFPGEQIRTYRVTHTAGSSMNVYAQLIEIDLPLYEYVEPQERKRLTIARTSLMRRVSAGARGSSGPLPPGVGAPSSGGGGGTTIPT